MDGYFEMFEGVPNPLIIKWIRNYYKISKELIAQAKVVGDNYILAIDGIFFILKQKCGLLLIGTKTKFFILM